MNGPYDKAMNGPMVNPLAHCVEQMGIAITAIRNACQSSNKA